VANCNADRMIDQYETLYADLIEQHRTCVSSNQAAA